MPFQCGYNAQCYIASIRCYSHYSIDIFFLTFKPCFGPKIQLSQWAASGLTRNTLQGLGVNPLGAGLRVKG